MIEYTFPHPNNANGYKLFPAELEENPCILFHGTAEKNFQSIIDNGFKANSSLNSVSYAKTSSHSLGHVCQFRTSETLEDNVVFAVRFISLNVPDICENISDIHVKKDGIQPEIIGFCIIPKGYRHL